MLDYVLKVAITAVLVVAVAEVGKRSSLFGAVLASIPLVSVLGMVWLYVDTHDTQKISSLAIDIFWLVIPSLLLFICLPVLLRKGVNFPLALLLSIAVTVGGYFVMIYLLRQFRIQG